jgi:hypothetical protein
VTFRLFAIAAVLAGTGLPAVAQPPPTIPKQFTCFDAPARANYDPKHDRFYVHYAAERIRMDRMPGTVPRYVNKKKNLEWRLDDGKATFSSLVPGSDELDRKLATCTYKRKR